MQITFFKELIMILKRKLLYAEDRYQSKKIVNFFLNQMILFIYK